MKFIMHRDRVVASTMGHAIRFEKGQPTHVPPELYREVIAAGGIPEEELPDDDDTGKLGSDEPHDPDAREKELFAAFEALIERAKREDFTASGAPHTKALQEVLGWKVEGKERDQAWAAFNTRNKPE